MKKFLFVFLLTPLICHAGGFALYEMNAAAQGLAQAYICRVNDPSAVWYNPAALTRLDGDQIYLSTTWIQPTGAFTPTVTGDRIKAEGGNYFPSNFYYSHQFSDRFTGALGAYTPFGL